MWYLIWVLISIGNQPMILPILKSYLMQKGIQGMHVLCKYDKKTWDKLLVNVKPIRNQK